MIRSSSNNENQDNPFHETDQQLKQAAEKQAYRAPTLTKHGRILELTRAMSGSPSDGFSGGPDPLG
jgi:hypothetical protein